MARKFEEVMAIYENFHSLRLERGGYLRTDCNYICTYIIHWRYPKNTV